jgi:formamidopyrimidine-DNA glycosylase
MPELPEVETARRLIADEALNRRIVAVDDADTYVTRPHIPGSCVTHWSDVH